MVGGCRTRTWAPVRWPIRGTAPHPGYERVKRTDILVGCITPSLQRVWGFACLGSCLPDACVPVLFLCGHAVDVQRPGGRVRYFLDVEFNGFGGEVISLALVPEDRDAAEFYEVLGCADPVPWVAAHVMPVLGREKRPRADVVRRLAAYLQEESHPIVMSDWPEDIAQLALLMITGPGWRMPSEQITMELLDLPLFDSEGLSATPHNALSDARAFRDYMLAQERAPSWAPGTKV